jgi:regulator of sirC expression with transglutaminase-like and TPR domain
MPLTVAYSWFVSRFVLLENCLAGKTEWDVPSVCFEIASEVVGTDLKESIGMFDIVDSWTAASTASQLMVELFGSGRLVGDRVTYDDPANSFLHSVIQRGRGIPLSLAMIVVEVGRRRGIDLDVVGMPGHVVVADPSARGSFYDPFHGARELDADGCRSMYEELTGLDNWRDDFLLPIDAQQQIWRMLNNLKSIYRRSGEIGKLRKVMIARSQFSALGADERSEFARLMRDTN